MLGAAAAGQTSQSPSAHIARQPFSALKWAASCLPLDDLLDPQPLPGNRRQSATTKIQGVVYDGMQGDMKGGLIEAKASTLQGNHQCLLVWRFLLVLE